MNKSTKSYSSIVHLLCTSILIDTITVSTVCTSHERDTVTPFAYIIRQNRVETVLNRSLERFRFFA